MSLMKELTIMAITMLVSASAVCAQESELPAPEASPSIVDIAGSGVPTDEQPEVECSEELIHASAGSGLVQVNDEIVFVNDAKHHTSEDKFGESMTVRELCEALNITPVDQYDNEEIDMDDTEHDSAKLWLDEENRVYIVFGTDRYHHDEPVPFGDLLTDSLATKTRRYTGVLWFPGGISNTGILSDGTRCTYEQLEKYAESVGSSLKYQDSSSVFETDSYRFGVVMAGVHYTVDISSADNTVLNFERLF